MIGRLRGVLAEVDLDHCVIDCAGVGYMATCGSRTLSRLPAIGSEAILYVHSQWSAEQGPRLYGFLDRDERKGKGASDHVPVILDIDDSQVSA